MRTMLDTQASALDAHERNFVANVRDHGWYNTQVMGDEGPGFSYTTGFWITLGVPEIILFSLKSNIAHDVLWDLFRDVKAGRQIPVGKYVADVFANGGAYFFPIAKDCHPYFLGWSQWFYMGNDFPCLQLVWSDTHGVFPWEQGFEERFRSDQPDLSAEGWIKSLTT